MFSTLQVTMADKEGAEKACANPNPMIDGRKANVNLAYLGAKPKLHSSQPGNIKNSYQAILLFNIAAYSYIADIKLLIVFIFVVRGTTFQG